MEVVIVPLLATIFIALLFIVLIRGIYVDNFINNINRHVKLIYKENPTSYNWTMAYNIVWDLRFTFLTMMIHFWKPLKVEYWLSKEQVEFLKK